MTSFTVPTTTDFATAHAISIPRRAASIWDEPTDDLWYTTAVSATWRMWAALLHYWAPQRQLIINKFARMGEGTLHTYYRPREGLRVVFICAVMAFAGATHAQSDCTSASVQLVVDGDTLILNGPSGSAERVRLSEVDAPESMQAFGVEAGQCLSAVLSIAPPQICRSGVDQYGRTLASMRVADIDVGSALVRLGCAWAYTAYLPRGSDLPAQQAAAKGQGAGLWGLSSTQAPWDFRKKLQAPPPSATKALHERVFRWLEVTFPEVTAGGAQTTFDGFGWARCYSSVCASYRLGQFFLLTPDGTSVHAGSGHDIAALAAAAGF